jgi:carbonic anhydrase/acetyltransferase-like protein (isoleucine patch superfamily)
MTEYFDFRDGKGAVPAHRHTNGGGWVADTAYVSANAYVGPDAKVFDSARVVRYARVSENARVFGNAKVFGSAQASGGAQVSGYVQVFDTAIVSGYAKISGDARIFGNAIVSNDAIVSGNAKVYGIKRSDGYTFIYVPDDSGVMKVQAGCRNFTMKEAKRHWKETRSGTPLGDETMEILKSLERLSKFKPEGCV